MKVRLAYGKEGLPVALADGWNVLVIEPAYVPGLADPTAAVRDALCSPIASEPLRERVKASDTVGITVLPEGPLTISYIREGELIV